ncbi:hypothetical protein HK102_010182, partial [Quaeritorhiza haematococci]
EIDRGYEDDEVRAAVITAQDLWRAKAEELALIDVKKKITRLQQQLEAVRINHRTDEALTNNINNFRSLYPDNGVRHFGDNRLSNENLNELIAGKWSEALTTQRAIALSRTKKNALTPPTPPPQTSTPMETDTEKDNFQQNMHQVMSAINKLTKEGETAAEEGKEEGEEGEGEEEEAEDAGEEEEETKNGEGTTTTTTTPTQGTRRTGRCQTININN